MKNLNWPGFFGVLWVYCAVATGVLLAVAMDNHAPVLSDHAKHVVAIWMFVHLMLTVLFGACQSLTRGLKK